MAEPQDTSPSPTVLVAMSLPSDRRLSADDLAQVVAPLELGPVVQDALIEQLGRLASAYQGREFADRHRAGHGESLELLDAIEESASTIVAALRRIQPDFVVALEIDRTGALNTPKHPAGLSARQLERELASWACMAADLRAKLSSRPAHRPKRSNLHFVVERLISGFDRHGILVKASRTSNSALDLRLTGEGGELIMRFFAVLDPQVTPAALYRIVTAIRRAQKAGRPARTDKSSTLPT